ncbi:nucleotidyltransferase domain-containing protein [Persephonella hydrogeniphila]|uniref:nucleotidyltransferase domain-containing protein n=1 Tax=Persephonella hydrogeniphila TaxID=198703 RepID=UPI000BE34831|nr:nucleotidyltransferase domain-containing protein [Persephonella hydrogeniphila]
MIKGYTREDYISLIGKAIEEATGGNCLIIFFGSIVDERFNRTSDIDVAIFCKEEISATDFLKIKDKIDKLPVLREVDLIDLRKTNNVELIQNILEKGKIWKNIPELLRDLKNHLQNLKKS